MASLTRLRMRPTPLGFFEYWWIRSIWGVIAFLFSSGVETPMKDGEILSASGSRWVGTGIRMFYFLAVIAIGSMLFAGAKKLIK